MSPRQTMSRLLLTFTLAGSLLFNAPLVYASGPSDSAVQDVELREGGVLTTRVVDLQGNPVAGQQVTIEFRGKQIATATSDEDGLVAVAGLRTGVHSISTPTGAVACRFWNHGEAPPSSVILPAVVSDQEIIRGQFGMVNFPMIVYAGISIAALIIAVDAENDANGAEDAAAALARRVEALENASP